MGEKLNQAYLKCQLNLMKRFLEDEKGASDMVTILVLIVIVIGVAVVFQDKLKQAIEAAFDNLINFVK